jgi:peptidoglycan/LPS O-acetylase OafA/YrhL
VTSAPPCCPRYLSLDIWRGVACLMIVVFHSTYYIQSEIAESHGIRKLLLVGLPHLWVGVPIFFVISGYCISAACDSMRRKEQSVRSYFWRRYRRIFPPFWACVLLTATVLWISGNSALFTESARGVAFPTLTSLSLSQWLGNLTLTESWRCNLGGNSLVYLLGQSWSLCYEEQFYIVCGILIFVAPDKFFRNATYLSAAVAAVASVSPRNPIHGFFVDGRWLTFALGMLVYWTLSYASEQTRHYVKSTAALVSVTTVASLSIRPIRIWLLSDIRTELLCALLFTTTLLYLRPLDAQIMRSPVFRPFSWAGTMCYSLYLCHWTVVKPISSWLWHHGFTSVATTMLVTLPLCLMTSLVVSRLFYLGVERHFLNVLPTPQPKLFASAATA